ncbi:MAG: hypothetical protein OXU36_06980 [Candidatus Poribacteria bacterium]|nr:hypothetical protein [Candidatus Poribacteria bacterium]
MLTFLSHINPLNLWVIAVVAIAIAEFTQSTYRGSNFVGIQYST